jgi:hypothetical protein
VLSSTAGDALAYCARIRDLILLHSGGWADADALYRFHLLSGAAARAAHDAQCIELLRTAEQYAKDLFSATAHHSWARGKTTGADILRLCILGKLDTLRERLTQLYGKAAWVSDGDTSRTPSRE